MKKSTYAVRIVNLAVLIAIDVILTRLCSVNTLFFRISFGFLPVVIAAMLYGPWYAGAGAAIADIVGTLIFPTGTYFPGFTLTAFLTGAVYGLLLYRKHRSVGQIIAAVLLAALLFEVGLNALWLHILTGKGMLALLPIRLVQAGIMVPIRIVGIFSAGRLVTHLDRPVRAS
ncbi:MAG: folate family ECF transporter S component [Intestinimonas sp.]|jgi:ECF transporter S component (folate family)|nr:folate family ECF transporter S component [Intestinimonas sp.]